MAGKQQRLEFDKSKTLADNQKLIFEKFPLPPSVNKLYKHFVHPKTRRVVRVSTEDLKRYKKSCEQWALANKRFCDTANLYLRDEPSLYCVAYVALHEKSIYTKDGKVRKMDVSNRGKALWDCLSEAIGVDDRHFSDCRLVRCIQDDFLPESVTVVISRTDHLTLEKIISVLRKSPEPPK